MLVTVQEDKGDPFVNHRARQTDASSPATATSSNKAKRFATKLDGIEESLGDADDVEVEDGYWQVRK